MTTTRSSGLLPVQGGKKERPVETSSRKRLQIEMTPDSFERLERLRATAGVATNTEVVRNALRLYEWWTNQVKKEGLHLKLVGPNGDVEREVELLL